MAYTFFDKKRGSEVKASVDEELAQELHQLVIKNFKMKRIFSRLRKIFGQQTQLKWNHYLLKIEVLNIYYV